MSFLQLSYKRVFSSYVLIFFLLISISENSKSDCLGLSPPLPQNTNVCETIFETLVIPRTEVFCRMKWWQRLAMPHCNLPGACHVDPTCKAFERTRDIASLVLNPGDLYCDFREISPERIIENIANQAFSDLTTLTTGGTSSILYSVANSHIDMMSCAGIPLNNLLKNIINCVTNNSPFSRREYFYPIDINSVRIISDTHPTANLYLRNGYDAITLADLVIIRDDKFEILKNWNKSSANDLTDEEREALVTMVHELVHVRQYREIGKEVFLNRYLAESVVRGYANISYEREAYRFDAWFENMLGRPLSCVSDQCKDYVQDNIAWDRNGRHNHWQENNLSALCGATRSVYSPGNCFQYVMRSGDDWGRTDEDVVNWGKAVRMCAGTSSARSSTRCLRRSVSAGRGFDNSIEFCRNRF